MGTPVLLYGEAQPKTHGVDGTPLFPTTLTSPSQPEPLVPRRVLSSTPSEENGEEVDKGCVEIKDVQKSEIMKTRGKY